MRLICHGKQENPFLPCWRGEVLLIERDAGGNGPRLPDHHRLFEQAGQVVRACTPWGEFGDTVLRERAFDQSRDIG